MKKYKKIDSGSLFLAVIILGILLFSSFRFYPPLAALAGILTIILVYRLWQREERKEKEVEQTIEELNTTFNDVTRTAVFSMPFPLVMITAEGEIKWYNNPFKQIFGLKDSILNEKVEEIVEEIHMADILDEEIDFIDVTVEDQAYRFYMDYFRNIGEYKEDVYLLYGVSATREKDIEKKYFEETFNAIILQIDNYDEIYDSTEEELRPMVFAEIDRVISEYFHKYQGYVKKYDQDSFMITLMHKDLLAIMEDRFTILDEIREIALGNTLPPTLSIGVNSTIEPPLELYRGALASMDIALGRGGDQAVVKEGEELHYYGGKNKALEKRTKVKARVIAHALQQMLRQADKVFIMGHVNPDMDSFGSCLGIYEACKLEKKRGYIVLNEVVPAIQNVYKKVLDYDSNYEKVFINSTDALLKASSKSLVVVVDNHRKASSECPDLLDITEHIVLIDHHRRGKDYIDNATITYLETYVSSASEMVTELLYYMEDPLSIPQVIAEALLAGITVDTKNFNYQTGVRTFEAASILKRQGADSISVKKLFKDDEYTIRSKSKVVANSEIYKGNIAIGVFDEKVDESILVASLSADELLGIIGVEASFVLTKDSGRIHISGRSLGGLSVQLILEKIGGGGHLTAAGAQLDTTMDEAVITLKQAIDEYIEEDQHESNSN